MVLASGFTSPAGTSGWLVARWQDGGYELIVSDHLLEELARTLGEDAYFVGRTTPRRVEAALTVLRQEAVVTPLTVPVVGVATQPKDDLVLSTALSGNASHLATRDRQLLKLGSYQGLSIVLPGRLRALLEQDEGDDAGA